MPYSAEQRVFPAAPVDGNDLMTAERHVLDLFHPRPQSPSADPDLNHPYITEIGDMRRLHFDWSSLQSEMDVHDPLRLTVDYTRVMMGFLFFNRHPKRIAMIGLGGGSLAKFCHQLLPQADITVVEIDPQVIGLRDRFLVPRDSDRFRVLCADGADYVRNASSPADILLVDGFDPFGQPPQLCSSAFYKDCYHRLSGAGVMAVNLWGDDRYNEHYQQRIDHAFHGEAVTVPTEGGSNRAVLARKDAPLALSKIDVMTVSASLDMSEAAFLPAIGRRIRQQCAKIERAVGTGRPAVASGNPA